MNSKHYSTPLCEKIVLQTENIIAKSPTNNSEGGSNAHNIVSTKPQLTEGYHDDAEWDDAP